MSLCAALALASTRCVVDFAGVEQQNEANAARNDGHEVRIGGATIDRNQLPMNVTKRMAGDPRAASSTASTENIPGHATTN